MEIGTKNFASYKAACDYYKKYGYSTSDVNRKIVECEIILGPPACKNAIIDPTTGRFFIKG